jgi:hypothetical protein
VQAEAKRHTDLIDISYLLEMMVINGETMPDELKHLIATDNVIRSFLGGVPAAERRNLRDLLTAVEIEVPHWQ